MIGGRPDDAIDRPDIPLPAGIAGRLLTVADTEALAALRRDVVSHQLEDPNCYRLEAESPDFPASHIGPDGPGDKGMILGLFDHEAGLVSYGALTLVRPGEPSRADALDLPEDQRDQVAYLASVMVRAEWRGQGLHHALIEWRLALAGLAGRRHAVSAVWPGNHRSWGHLLAHGLQVKKLVWVGNALPRLVAHRDLNAPAPRPIRDTIRLIALPHLTEQAALFDEGYWLWRRVTGADGVLAELARPQPAEV